MQTTLKKVIEFNNNALQYLTENLDKNTSFTYALTKVQKKCAPIIEKMQKELNEFAEDQRIELCQKEKDGTLKEKVIGEGEKARTQRIFKSEDLKQLSKNIAEKQEELLNEEVEIPFHWCKKEFIPKLNMFYIDAFLGFVIEPMDEAELEKWFVGMDKEATSIKKEPTPTN